MLICADCIENGDCELLLKSIFVDQLLLLFLLLLLLSLFAALVAAVVCPHLETAIVILLCCPKPVGNKGITMLKQGCIFGHQSMVRLTIMNQEGITAVTCYRCFGWLFIISFLIVCSTVDWLAELGNQHHQQQPTNSQPTANQQPTNSQPTANQQEEGSVVLNSYCDQLCNHDVPTTTSAATTLATTSAATTRTTSSTSTTTTTMNNYAKMTVAYSQLVQEQLQSNMALLLLLLVLLLLFCYCCSRCRCCIRCYGC